MLHLLTMQRTTLQRILLATLLGALAPMAVAQDTNKAETFPSKGWQKIKLKDKQRKQLNWSIARQLTPMNLYKLDVERPEDYTETVITDIDGVVLGRNTGNKFEFRDRQIGDRYVIYFCRSKERRALRFLEEFVEYPHRNFPTKAWQPTKDSTLNIKNPKQFTPKTMMQAFDKPHSVTFKVAPSKEPCVFLLAKLEAGGEEHVAAQSLIGKLDFWMHAKRGESFRIYQIFPHNKTYRASQTMTIEKDYPLGK